MKTIRFGIIGLGNQGYFYAAKLFGHGWLHNAELTAICDVNERKLNRYCEKTGNDHIARFTDYKALLDSGLCDAVLVETPHDLHPEIVIESLRRGIHVLSDKPAGVYTKQVREMNAVAEGAEARFSMMLNQRANPIYAKMREIVRSGALGELQRLNWIITDWYRTDRYYNGGSWRANWRGEGGGVLLNQSIHQLDLLSWIIGEMPIGVRGFCKYGRWHDIEVEDDVTAVLTYQSGITGVFVTTTGETPGVNRFEIVGTGGTLLADGEDRLVWTKNEVDSRDWIHTDQTGYIKPSVSTEIFTHDQKGKCQHAEIINNFIDALLGRAELIAEGTEGIYSMELMNAIELSGWNHGEEIAVPVDEERYLDALNAHRAISKPRNGDNDRVVENSNSRKV